MTTLRDAARQALEVLDAGVSVSPKSVLHDRLRAALAQEQQEQQGPVVWDASAPLVMTPHPAFAHPPRREWRSLTMQEINALPEVGGRMWNMGSAVAVLQAIRAVEAKLKERNT